MSRSAIALACPVLVLFCAAAPPLVAGPDPVLTITGAGPAPPYELSFLLDHEQSANGWALVICHDPTGVALESVGLGAVGSAVNGGNPPEFSELLLYPNGWSMGVVISLVGAEVLPAGTGLEIGTALYTGLADGAWSVCTCTLGPTSMVTIIVYDGASIAPPPACGTITVDTSIHEFRRGDANIDGVIDLADPIFVLVHLFISGPAPPCAAAGDADASGFQDIGDAVLLLSYLFSGGPPPAPPFPGCGSDPAADCDVTACP